MLLRIENENNNNEYPGLKLPIDYYFELNDVDITNKDNNWDPIKKEFSTELTITSLPYGNGYDVVDVDRDELAYQPEIKLDGYCNPQNDIDNNLWVTLESPYLTKKITQKFPLLPGYSTQPINENGKRAIGENEINITSNGTYILGQNDQDPDDLEIDLSTKTENLKTLTLSDENDIHKNTNTNTNVNTFTLGKFKIDINTSTVPVILNENSQEILTIEQYNQINNTNFIGFSSIDISSLLKMAINIPEYDFNKFKFQADIGFWDGSKPDDIMLSDGKTDSALVYLFIYEINEYTITITAGVPPKGAYYIERLNNEGDVDERGVVYDNKVLQNHWVFNGRGNPDLYVPFFMFGKLINKPQTM